MTACWAEEEEDRVEETGDGRQFVHGCNKDRKVMDSLEEVRLALMGIIQTFPRNDHLEKVEARV